MKSVISLNHTRAKAFFLEEANYCSIDLPKYFKTKKLLHNIDKFLGLSRADKYFSFNSISNKFNLPNDFDDVNYNLYGNKDGELGWRKFELVHPVLYVDLVNLITSEKNWRIICNRFEDFKKNRIRCASIPEIKSTKKSRKADQVLQWWENIEQDALKLGIEYSYVYDADIAGYYGSIYTHIIPRALHGKEQARNDRGANKLLGSQIDRCFQSMHYRQTNGIPEGNAISDFISELISGYIDEILSNRIKDMNVEEYKIIRYRDDYKIFTNRPDQGRMILKLLSETLSEMGMKLNHSKTKEGLDPILASVKDDKIDELFIPKKSDNYSKWLMQIYSTANKHPNSGKVARQLNIYHESLLQRIDSGDRLKKYENPEVMISIIANLAIKNPKYYNWCTAIISILLECCPQYNRKFISEKIVSRFSNVPNVGLLDIWLQRVTFPNNNKRKYKEKICNLVKIDQYPGNREIWNSNWLEKKLSSIVNETRIVSKYELKKLKPIIKRDETDLFRNLYEA